MTFRALRSWIVLVNLAAVFSAALSGSVWASALAAASCILGAVALAWLDGLRRSGRMRR